MAFYTGVVCITVLTVDVQSSFTPFEVVDSLSGFHCDVFIIFALCAFKFIIKMCPQEI